MNSDRLALLADARLSGDARVVGLLILEMGDGWHELDRKRIAALFGGLSNETVRRTIRRLESTGWIEVNSNTGRRPSQYRFVTNTESGPLSGLRNALTQSLIDLLPHTDEGQTLDSAPHTRGANGTPHTDEGPTKSLPLVDEDLTASTPHTRGADMRVVGSRGSRSRSTSSGERAGARFTIDARVQEVLDSDQLEGARGSITDYLAERVETHRQWGWLCTVRGWFNGLTGSPRGFANLDTVDQVGTIASALNELLQDDELSYRSARGRVGSVYTLRTKVELLLKMPAGSDVSPAAQSEAAVPAHLAHQGDFPPED